MTEDDRPEWEPVPIEEAVERLADIGHLGDRQAAVYVRRNIEAEPRRSVAQALGISPSTVDSTLQRAREKVEQAERTVEAIDALRHRPLPEECAECGATLGGTWATDEDDRPLCLNCAEVDPSQVDSIQRP